MNPRPLSSSIEMIHSMFVAAWVRDKHGYQAATQLARERAELEGEKFMASVAAIQHASAGLYLCSTVESLALAERKALEMQGLDAPTQTDAQRPTTLADMLTTEACAEDLHLESSPMLDTAAFAVYQHVHQVFLGLCAGSSTYLPVALRALAKGRRPVHRGVFVVDAVGHCLAPLAAAFLSFTSPLHERTNWKKQAGRDFRAAQRTLRRWAACDTNLSRIFVGLAESGFDFARGRNQAAVARLETVSAEAIAGEMPQIAGLCARVTAAYWQHIDAWKPCLLALARAQQFFALWHAANLVARTQKHMEALGLEHDIELAPYIVLSTHHARSTTPANDGTLTHSRHHLTTSHRTGTSHGGASENSTFDLAAVFEASQSLARERSPGSMTAILLKALLANCGATRVCLLAVEGDRELEFRQEGEARVDAGKVVCFDPPIDPRPRAEDLPLSVLRRATRTNQRITSDTDAALANSQRDPYFLQTKPKTWFTTPLRHQGQIHFLLYLEHKQLAGAFGDSRIRVAEVLGTQMMLSLESAALLGRLELRNAELGVALEQAQAADRIKGRFLANISHELRTPLNGIIGTSELLGDTALAEEQRELLSMIELSGQRLAHTIAQILDFGDLEGGETTLKLGAVDLPALAAQLHARFSPAAHVNDVEFTYKCDIAEDQLVVSDLNALTRILSQLIDNAVKFTLSGRIELHLCLNPAGRQIEIKLHDTGIGIAPQQLASLGKRFAPGDDSMTKRHAGIGLGLALTRRLVALLEGDIRFESTEGQGTLVQLYLPLQLVNEAQICDGDLPVKHPRDPSPGQANRVLIVEDNRLNRTLLAKMMDKLGLDSDIAEDGAKAVERYAEHAARYTCVLMDCQMPVMDGYEATRRIRAMEEAKRVRGLPIIAVTANARSGDRDRCLAAGCDDFLAKPVKLGEVREILAKYGILDATPATADAA